MSELYRQSGRRRSAKLMPTSADRGVSRAQRNGSPRPLISVFWTGAATIFIQVAPQLTSRGWVDPVPDPLLLRKSGSAGNRTRDLYICSQKLWPLDHRGGLIKPTRHTNSSNLFLDWNSTCFGQFLCPSSGVFHCTHSNVICHTVLLTYTIARCKELNSWWWWTEELSETCRISFQE